MYHQLISKRSKLAVVGLGYVGLPLALEFSKYVSVIGFDIKQKTVKMLQDHQDPNRELSPEAFKNRDIVFTHDPEDLKEASFYIIAVPTPVDKHNKPDLRPLQSATLNVANALSEGDYVVYESTVYPGCTVEECVPLLERVSGLRYRKEFKVGYSPERISPGDLEHSLQNTIKIVSGRDAESLDLIAKTYELIVKAGVHRAPTIRVAEAAKVIENTQRDVNIALMNELSIIFNRMGINTYDVIEAARTKWNFLPFTPGLVGGHCIGVDPYYLVHKATELKYHPQMIHSGRFINDSMGGYIAKQTVKKLLANDLPLLRARVLVMGFTFKENVADVRNTKVADIVKELYSYRISVDVVDPKADPHIVEEEYDIKLMPKPAGKYHAVIMAVPHNEYRTMTEADFREFLDPKGIVIDLKGIYKDTIENFRYWSL